MAKQSQATMDAVDASPKWFLDSTTVRVALLAILPSVKVLLAAFNIEVGGDTLNAAVDIICFVVGIGTMVYQIRDRHQRKGGLSFFQQKGTTG